jgi:hypothetical protein
MTPRTMPRTAVQADADNLRLRIERLATEYWDGRWHWPSNAEPEALVTYATEPSPETGHVGWCWWAQGKTGETNSYESACAAAVITLRFLRESKVAP